MVRKTSHDNRNQDYNRNIFTSSLKIHKAVMYWGATLSLCTLIVYLLEYLIYSFAPGSYSSFWLQSEILLGIYGYTILYGIFVASKNLYPPLEVLYSALFSVAGIIASVSSLLLCIFLLPIVITLVIMLIIFPEAILLYYFSIPEPVAFIFITVLFVVKLENAFYITNGLSESLSRIKKWGLFHHKSFSL